MKRTIWIGATLLTAVLICGCGGEEKKKSSNATSQAPPTSVSTILAEEVASFKSSTPKEAVTEFLDALRAGDKTTTEALLTNKAREETKSHDLVVEPPGAPGATYSLGRVEQIDGAEQAAYVNCVWAEEENEERFEVVWILRREQLGWRIAGMATELPDYDEPVMLNFEDLSELENVMQEAEIAERQNAATPPAQGTTTLR